MGNVLPFVSQFTTHIVVHNLTSEDVRKLKEVNYGRIIVDSDWLIKCHKRNEFVDYSPFLFDLRSVSDSDVNFSIPKRSYEGRKTRVKAEKLSVAKVKVEKKKATRSKKKKRTIFGGKTFSFSKDVQNDIVRKMKILIRENGGKVKENQQGKYVIYNLSSFFNCSSSNQHSVTTFFINKCLNEGKWQNINGDIFYTPIMIDEEKGFFRHIKPKIFVTSMNNNRRVRERLVKIVELLHGLLEKTVNPKVNILVTPINREKEDEREFLEAKRMRISCVSVKWLIESAKKGYFIDPKQFYHRGSTQYVNKRFPNTQLEFVQYESQRIGEENRNASLMSPETQVISEQNIPMTNNKYGLVDNTKNRRREVTLNESEKIISQLSGSSSSPDNNKLGKKNEKEDEIEGLDEKISELLSHGKKKSEDDNDENDDEDDEEEGFEFSVKKGDDFEEEYANLTRKKMQNQHFFDDSFNESEIDEEEFPPMSQTVIVQKIPLKELRHYICISRKIPVDDKKELVDAVKKLGAVCQQSVDENTTHYVCKKFGSSTNVIKSIIKGIYIVKPMFLKDSGRKNQFQDEKFYFFEDSEIKFPLATKMFNPKHMGRRVFDSWIVGILCVKDDVESYLVDIFQFGNGKTVVINETTPFQSNLTHLIISKDVLKKIKRNEKFRQSLKSYVMEKEIIILTPTFLKEMFIHPRKDLRKVCLKKKLYSSLKKRGRTSSTNTELEKEKKNKKIKRT